MGHVLLIETDPVLGEQLRRTLALWGHQCTRRTPDPDAGVDLVAVAVGRSDHAADTIGHLRESYGVPVVIMLAPEDAHLAPTCLEAGAYTVLVKTHPVADRVGEQIAAIVDGSRRAEAMPVTNQAAFQASLLDRVPTPVIATTMDGVIKYWNPAAGRLHGWSASEVMGRDAGSLLFPEAERRRVAPALRELPSSGAWEGDLDLLTADGSTFPAHLSLTKLHAVAHGEPVILGVTMDLSERRALEARLLQAQKMEAVGTLAGGLAHDFNNLLTGVLGSAALVREMPEIDSSISDLMDLVERSALRGRDLCKQLLSFSRAERPTVEPVVVEDAISEVVTLVERTVSPDVHLSVEVAADLPSILADRSRVNQALMNLLLNSRDAMPSGGSLRIAASMSEGVPPDDLHQSVSDGQFVRLEVRDDGDGMPRDVMARAYEPFFTTKGAGRGTGLGLSIVFSIAKAHGGFVRIWSRVGQGSTVAVFIPVSGDHGVAAEPVPADNLDEFRGTETVLLVDDEAVPRGVGARILRQFGYETVEAGSGPDALRTLSQDPARIHAILLDVVMPEMEGPEVYERLRAAGVETPVILCSGFSVAGLADELMRSGVAAVVNKPYQLKELLPVLREVLDRNPARVGSR